MATYVPFDPSVLGKPTNSVISEAEDDDFESAESICETLMKVFGATANQFDSIVIPIVDVVFDSEALRRDGYIQEFAKKLGKCVGHASRLFKKARVAFNVVTACLEAIPEVFAGDYSDLNGRLETTEMILDDEQFRRPGFIRELAIDWATTEEEASQLCQKLRDSVMAFRKCLRTILD